MMRVLMLIVVVALLALAALPLIVHESVADRAYPDASSLPAEREPRVALVFGAGLTRDGRASPILYDRVSAAAELYQAGRVNKLLLSGDHSSPQHNEPQAMLQVALALGVPRAALVLDGEGLRTYDSCFRAKTVFGVKRAVMVTQRFHLDRALYTCMHVGIDSVGVAADRRNYGSANYTYWTLREYPATLQAFLDLSVLNGQLSLAMQ